MSRVDEMVRALRKCAKEHENEVVCTGQVITSSLCRDVADYLEANRWHYPSKGELPPKWGFYLVTLEYSDTRFVTLASWHELEHKWYGFNGDWYNPIAWMPLPELPKEEA